jgi:hypothetical protein
MLKITGTDIEDQPERMYFTEAIMVKELQLHRCVHQPLQPKVPAKVLPHKLLTMVADQHQVRV